MAADNSFLALAWLALALCAGGLRTANAAPLSEAMGPAPARPTNAPAPLAAAAATAAARRPRTDLVTRRAHPHPGLPDLAATCRTVAGREPGGHDGPPPAANAHAFVDCPSLSR